MQQIAAASPSFKARIAGFFYLLTFLLGIFSLVFVRGALIANLIASACYVVVTILFYDLFKPVNSQLSLIAALFSFAGCAIGVLGAFHFAPFHLSSLPFFGIYCVSIGYLILKSTFLPRILGVLMALGGVGWLTFLFPLLAKPLDPYNLAPGILGEGVLTVWLLVAGVNVEKWKEREKAMGFGAN